MRITALIRKYAAPLALLSALSGAAAAPYLIPENPDSAVFRSGVLGLLLILASIKPIKQALIQADTRTLICGMTFGLLLGTALSLGAELYFYEGLLPGAGSMLRRIAVPILSMPLLGGLAVRALLLSAPSSQKHLHLPMWVYMVILLLCWLPLLIAYYPGMLNYDFHTEYGQFISGQWDQRHPLLYIVLCYAVLSAGQLLNQPELAILAVTLLRMIVFAAALAYSCMFVQRRQASRSAMLILTASYAFLPVFSVMAVSSAKDTPFSAAVLTLSLLCWEALENPKAFFASKRRITMFILSIVFTWHMRKNGIVVLVMLPLLIAAAKGYRKQLAKACAAAVAFSALLACGMNAILHPVQQPSFQTYSVPAQQLARAYNLGSMTEEEREELRGWYVDSDWGLQLLPHLADAAKGSLNPDRLAKDGDQFMDLWGRVGRKNMRIYIEAFLMLNIGSWYPDDKTHATIYQPYGLDKGYLQTDEYDLSEHGIRKYNLLPKVRSFYEQLCRRNTYSKYPLIAPLFCTATPLWVILFACSMLIARGKGRYAVCASGVLALWLSYMFGPCTLARYMLPLFCLAPAVLLAAVYPYSTREKE